MLCTEPVPGHLAPEDRIVLLVFNTAQAKAGAYQKVRTDEIFALPQSTITGE